MTDLHDAAKAGNLNKCRKLIEQAADVNAKDDSGETTLHWAAKYGYLEICELLLKHGADVAKTNNEIPHIGSSDR